MISAAARVAAEREKRPGLGPSLEESLAATLRPRRRRDDAERVEKRPEAGRADAATTTSAEAATEATT